MADEPLKIKFDDDDAVGRVTRAIIMSLDAAIGRLLGMGYDRDRDKITIERDDASFCERIKVGRTVVFTVQMIGTTEGASVFQKWVDDADLPKPRR